MGTILDIRCFNNSDILINGIAKSGKSLLLDILTNHCMSNNITVIPSDDADSKNHVTYFKNFENKMSYNYYKDPRIKTIQNKNFVYDVSNGDGKSDELCSLVYAVLIDHCITNINKHFTQLEFTNIISVTITTRTMKIHGISVNDGAVGSASSF